jgi:hypothetical protein
MSWNNMLLRVVFIVFLLFAASACTSNAPKTDTVKVEGVPVFAADSSGENLVQVDGNQEKKRKMKCRTEVPTGSHIHKRTCYWEDDLKRASEEASRMLNTLNRNTSPN